MLRSPRGVAERLLTPIGAQAVTKVAANGALAGLIDRLLASQVGIGNAANGAEGIFVLIGGDDGDAPASLGEFVSNNTLPYMRGDEGDEARGCMAGCPVTRDATTGVTREARTGDEDRQQLRGDGARHAKLADAREATCG